MQALAWVATRDAPTVLRASLEEPDYIRAIATLGDATDWHDDKPGLSAVSIGMRMLELATTASKGDVDAVDACLAELVTALRKGEVIASAEPYNRDTNVRGDRRELSMTDWAALTLREGPHHERALQPFYVSSGAGNKEVLASQWSNILIASTSLIGKWPVCLGPNGASAMTSAAVSEAASPATSTAMRPPFDPAKAVLLLMIEKVHGVFQNKTPTILEARKFLTPHFRGMGNEALRSVLRHPKLWPVVKPGPRAKR